MTHPPLDRLRAYANAEADVTARLLVEAHLAFCPGCATTVADYRRMGEPLPDDTLADQFDVPAFDRVWTAVEHALGPRRAPTVLPPSFLAALPHPYAWRWLTIAWPARVRVAVLIRDADTGSTLYLCHFAPGGTFPRHCHVGLEENVILAGAYHTDDVHAETGDWVTGPPGTEELARADNEGCWCVSRVEPPGVRFTGWRRWIVPLLARGSSTGESRSCSRL